MDLIPTIYGSAVLPSVVDVVVVSLLADVTIVVVSSGLVELPIVLAMVCVVTPVSAMLVLSFVTTLKPGALVDARAPVKAIVMVFVWPLPDVCVFTELLKGVVLLMTSLSSQYRRLRPPPLSLLRAVTH